MKRRALLTLAALSLVLGLSACGGKGSSANSEAESSKVEQENQEESKAEKTEEESSAKLL